MLEVAQYRGKRGLARLHPPALTSHTLCPKSHFWLTLPRAIGDSSGEGSNAILGSGLAP